MDKTDLRAVVFSKNERIPRRWRNLHKYGLWYSLQYFTSGLDYLLSRSFVTRSRLPEGIDSLVWRTDGDEKKVARWLQDKDVETVFVCGFQFILGGGMLDAFPFIVNIHSSLLPDYRGPEPIIWGLLDKTSQFGITLHVLDRGIDTGNIICHGSVDKPRLPFKAAVERKLAKILPGLLHKTIHQLERNTLESTPQLGGFYLSLPTLRNRRERIQRQTPSSLD
jgi:methionyl-tRNA formyltransferase